MQVHNSSMLPQCGQNNWHCKTLNQALKERKAFKIVKGLTKIVNGPLNYLLRCNNYPSRPPLLLKRGRLTKDSTFDRLAVPVILPTTWLPIAWSLLTDDVFTVILFIFITVLLLYLELVNKLTCCRATAQGYFRGRAPSHNTRVPHGLKYISSWGCNSSSDNSRWWNNGPFLGMSAMDDHFTACLVCCNMFHSTIRQTTVTGSPIERSFLLFDWSVGCSAELSAFGNGTHVIIQHTSMRDADSPLYRSKTKLL